MGAKVACPVQTSFHGGWITVSEVMNQGVATVTMGTALAEVAQRFIERGSRYVLVTGDDGGLVGVVTEHDLIRHFSLCQERDTDAMQGKTVESVMCTRFVCGSPMAKTDDVATLMSGGGIECLPIVENGKLLGAVTPDDLLVSWNRLHPVLEQAGTDHLTGLANRATFDRRLSEELERARRERSPLSVLLCDVDKFKQINDNCGHQQGDAVLRMVAGCLRRQLRNYDVIARYGGDEFAAICCGCDASFVEAPLRRLQQATRCLSIPCGNGQYNLSLSIGVATLKGDSGAVDAAGLVKSADECMYEAKRQGRNRVCKTEFGNGTTCCSSTER